MSVKKKLTLLRHGETDYPNRYIGSRDVPLAPAGVTQIKGLRKHFKNQGVDRIVASPMQRCTQSCELLFPGCDMSCDDDLREIDFGRWEGLSFQEIVERDPDIVEKWASWSPDFRFPEGESIGHFVSRVKKAGTRLMELTDKNIVLITHGGVVRALLCYYLGLAPENYLLFQVEKGRFATLDLYDGLGVLTGFNLG